MWPRPHPQASRWPFLCVADLLLRKPGGFYIPWKNLRGLKDRIADTSPMWCKRPPEFWHGTLSTLPGCLHAPNRMGDEGSSCRPLLLRRSATSGCSLQATMATHVRCPYPCRDGRRLVRRSLEFTYASDRDAGNPAGPNQSMGVPGWYSPSQKVYGPRFEGKWKAKRFTEHYSRGPQRISRCAQKRV